jgi:hypothetical protein
MDTKELIEKQIEEAAEHFDAMIEAPKFTHAWGKAVEGCCGNLLRAVQNQQAQIERLQDWRRAICDHDHLVFDVCQQCGAKWEDVRR